MIVLYHTFFIVTKYILTIISKSISSTIHSPVGEYERRPNVSLGDKNYLIESEVEIVEGVGLRFFPPVYIQRYTAVKNVLQDERWSGKIRKVVDFGCAEFGFFVYMKHLPGIQEVLAVDIDREILESNYCRAAPLSGDYMGCSQRSEPLVVHILNGSIADTDPRLLHTDAVVCIELIEHLYPDTLEEVPYTVFGYIQPLVAIFTTPNSDFNVLFPNLLGFRHPDHKFEWTCSQFEEWAFNITTRYPAYNVEMYGIGNGPLGTESYGCCSQMAIFVKTDYQSHVDDANNRLQHEVTEVCETDLIYEEIRCYEFPYYVDNRTDDEKILHEAEYCIRMLACHEKYNTASGIYIPMQHILPHVEKWHTSNSMLRNILEDAGWEVFGEPHDKETYIIYPRFDEESSVSESEDFGVEEQVLYIAENMEDDWDKPIMDELIPDDNECRDALMCSEEWECSGSSEKETWTADCEMQEDRSFNSQSVNSGMTEYKSSVGYDDQFSESKSVNLKVGSDTLNAVSIRTQVIDKEISKTSTTDMQRCSNSAIMQELDKRPSSDLEEGAAVSFPPIESYNSADIFDRCLEIDESSASACSNFMETLKNEGCSYNEALTKHKLDIHRVFPHNVSVENIMKNRNSTENLVLDKSPEYIFSDQQAMHLQTSNANSSHSNKVNYFDMIGRQLTEGESEEMQLNFVPESLASSRVNQTPYHTVCVGCTTPSTLESSQERSLVESCSLDEQNDKAVDSGYPNSYSVQDMDMDLTPEQVDEIFSESEEIASENSNSYSVESDSESDDNNHDHNHLINNDGYLLNFRNELLYDPMVVVENGDVANNNRDGEGNNAVAVVPLPIEPEIEDEIDHEFIPLLAAVEDFDNDNDLIIPEDVQPFPHWLLHLLGLVHPVNGGGDLNNYLQPPVNVLPDEGQRDVDSEEEVVARGSISSDLGSDVVSDDFNLDNLEEAEEVIVPGDIGGGGEPN